MFGFGIIIILVVLIALGLSIWAFVKKDSFGDSNDIFKNLKSPCKGQPNGSIVDNSTLEDTKSYLKYKDCKYIECVDYGDNPNNIFKTPKTFNYVKTADDKYSTNIYGIYNSLGHQDNDYFSTLTCDELSNL